jgi:hypothetical protein
MESHFEVERTGGFFKMKVTFFLIQQGHCEILYLNYHEN